MGVSHNRRRYVQFGADAVMFRAEFNVMQIMRCALELESRLVKTAELYAPGRTGADAVTHLLDDYPRLVAEIRQLRKRVHQLDAEEAEFDARLEALHSACRALLDL